MILGDDTHKTSNYYTKVLILYCLSYPTSLSKQQHPEYKKSKMTVLYLNSLLSAIGVSIIIIMVPGEIDRVKNFPLWSNTSFVTYLVFASLMGSVLNLAIFLCTSTNSALTTTVVGCLKNVLTSYLGMLVGGDYIFSWLSFLGINISIAGSLIYARATFRGWEEMLGIMEWIGKYQINNRRFPKGANEWTNWWPSCWKQNILKISWCVLHLEWRGGEGQVK